MKFLIACITCLLVILILPACAPPRPTETPAVAPKTQPAGVRTAAPSPRETPPAVAPTDDQSAAITLPTARPHLYDEVDEAAILGAVFPNLQLTQADDRYNVQGSDAWQVWVNDRDEGFVTQNQRSELIAIIGNQVGANPPPEEAAYGPSSSILAILEKQNGKLVVTHRQTIEPVASPSETDVRLERAVDVDHNGTEELLLTFSAIQSAAAHIEAHLFQWQGNKLVDVWKGIEQDDNTAVANQDQYYSYQAIIDFEDVNKDNKEELTVSGERILYNKDADGNPDFSNAPTVLADRQVFKWNGTSYELDKALTTPPAPEPTP